MIDWPLYALVAMCVVVGIAAIYCEVRWPSRNPDNWWW
jgi:hypothetical protein